MMLITQNMSENMTSSQVFWLNTWVSIKRLYSFLRFILYFFNFQTGQDFHLF